MGMGVGVGVRPRLSPSQHRFIHVGIVGSGPSAFYTAKYLLRQSRNIAIDMIERLPAPFGLVRYGVAPDHPDTKIVMNDFHQTLEHARCRFFGNVDVGRDVSVDELRSAYDGIVIASGAGSERCLGIPGEHLTNSLTARSFVNWYNGHPDHSHDWVNLKVRDSVVIGNGNVALDVARTLCSDAARFHGSDIADHALRTLETSLIRRVLVIGRRAAPQASFTSKELREIVNSTCFKTFVSSSDLDTSRMTLASVVECRHRAVRRKLEILAQAEPATDFSQDGLHFRFNLRPIEIVANPDDPDSVGGVVFEHCRLSGEPGHQEVIGTGRLEMVNAGLVIRSVGYRSLPLPSLPFDERKGVIPSDNGRIVEANGEPVPFTYVTGWVKRGPKGIIASNIIDAQETVAAILSDIKTESTADADRDRLWSCVLNRGVVIVHKNMWKLIDAKEIERGQAMGKVREKFADRDALIAGGRGADDAA